MSKARQVKQERYEAKTWHGAGAGLGLGINGKANSVVRGYSDTKPRACLVLVLAPGGDWWYMFWTKNGDSSCSLG